MDNSDFNSVMAVGFIVLAVICSTSLFGLGFIVGYLWH